VVCAIEAAIVAVLAVQVFGGSAAPAPVRQLRQPPPATAATSAGTSAVAATSVPGATPPRTASDPVRTEAAAKFVAGDPVGVLLTGTVRTRDGRPADASLSASLDKARASASSTEDGSYAMLGLQPGEWQVTVRGTGIVEQSTQLTITDDAVQHRDFMVDPSFAVKVLIVTPDGGDATTALRKTMSGMGDFSAAGQRDPLPERLAPTEYGMGLGDAKWDAQMNPKDGFAGTMHFTALPAHMALLLRHILLEQQLVQPGQREVKFVVDVEAMKKLAASATVRVLDASGEPLATAHISLTMPNYMSTGQPVNAQGRAELTGLSPGLLRCSIYAPDHEEMYTTLKAEPGQHLDLGDVRLGAEVKCTGTVLDADGRPANANMAWTELKWRQNPSAFGTNRTARTEADGAFTLWHTGAGVIAIAASDTKGNIARGVFDNPPAVPIVLRLSPACEGTVTRPPDPARSFMLTLFDGARRPLTAFGIEPRSTKQPIRMPAGSYPFEVHDEQFRLVQSGTLEFGATPCTLEIR
jgi:hypothetical protein